jgi:hypothetical protein
LQTHRSLEEVLHRLELSADEIEEVYTIHEAEAVRYEETDKIIAKANEDRINTAMKGVSDERSNYDGAWYDNELFKNIKPSIMAVFSQEEVQQAKCFLHRMHLYDTKGELDEYAGTELGSGIICKRPALESSGDHASDAAENRSDASPSRRGKRGSPTKAQTSEYGRAKIQSPRKPVAARARSGPRSARKRPYSRRTKRQLPQSRLRDVVTAEEENDEDLTEDDTQQSQPAGLSGKPVQSRSKDSGGTANTGERWAIQRAVSATAAVPSLPAQVPHSASMAGQTGKRTEHKPSGQTDHLDLPLYSHPGSVRHSAPDKKGILAEASQTSDAEEIVETAEMPRRALFQSDQASKMKTLQHTSEASSSRNANFPPLTPRKKEGNSGSGMATKQREDPYAPSWLHKISFPPDAPLMTDESGVPTTPTPKSRHKKYTGLGAPGCALFDEDEDPLAPKASASVKSGGTDRAGKVITKEEKARMTGAKLVQQQKKHAEQAKKICTYPTPSDTNAAHDTTLRQLFARPDYRTPEDRKRKRKRKRGEESDSDPDY